MKNPFDDPALKAIRESLYDPTLKQVYEPTRNLADLLSATPAPMYGGLEDDPGRTVMDSLAESARAHLINSEHDATKRLMASLAGAGHVDSHDSMRHLLRDPFDGVQTSMRAITESIDNAYGVQNGILNRFQMPEMYADAFARYSNVPDSFSALMQKAVIGFNEALFRNPLAELEHSLESAFKAVRWPSDVSTVLPSVSRIFETFPEETSTEADASAFEGDDEPIDAAVAVTAISTIARALDSAAPEFATKADLDEALATILDFVRRQFEEAKPKGLQRFIDSILLPLVLSSAVAMMQARGAFDPPSSAASARPEVAVQATTTSAPRLFVVNTSDVRLRDTPSFDGNVREKLARGESVTAVEVRDDGWVLVKVRVHAQSHLQGWVAKVCLTAIEEHE